MKRFYQDPGDVDPQSKNKWFWYDDQIPDSDIGPFDTKADCIKAMTCNKDQHGRRI